MKKIQLGRAAGFRYLLTLTRVSGHGTSVEVFSIYDRAVREREWRKLQLMATREELIHLRNALTDHLNEEPAA